jgi:hypothetical protein
MNFQVKKIIILVLIFLFFGCSSRRLIVNSVNLNEISNAKQNSIIYCLPKTILTIDVVAVKTTEFCGPYNQYAEKLLGLKNVPLSKKVTWDISNIQINSIAVPDSLNYYLIDFNKSTDANYVSLTKEGFLIGINSRDALHSSFDNSNENPLFNLVNNESLGSTIEERTDTLNDSQTIDSIYNKIPYPKKLLDNKTISEQAFILAQTIFTIRDDINALLNGEADSKVSLAGETLKLMISELKKMEQQYLTQFVGVKITEKHNYRYIFEPGESKTVTQKILFRFSSDYGILSNRNVKGGPIAIELNNTSQTNVIKMFQSDQKRYHRVKKLKNKNNGLMYRIPENVTVKLLDGEKIIAQKQILINQYGPLLSLPSSLLENNEITFYPFLGSLRKISKTGIQKK